MRHPVRRLILIAAIAVAGFAATNSAAPTGPGSLLHTMQVASYIGPPPLAAARGPIS